MAVSISLLTMPCARLSPGNLDEVRFKAFVQNHNDCFAGDFVIPSFLDNHDMDRFSYVARNNSDPLKRAVAAQMRLPIRQSYSTARRSA